ncbi:MAG: ABC transporter substrate-binding protein, partial [Thermomicrobiales bacterium]
MADSSKQLFQDVMAGKLSRREVLKRGTALGLSATVIAGISQESLRTAMAQDRDPILTIYQWMFDLHPTLPSVCKESGIKTDIAPVAGFSFDRFVAEAKDKKSTWDFYAGVTPFLEMQALAETGTIEPWDAYIPEAAQADLIPATKAEGSYKSATDTKPGLYVWPFLLDVIVQGWHAGIVEKAGLDPEVAPKNWDEFLANAQKVKDSKAAPYGLVFDFHDWRSLIPITHSISTDVYTADGLFKYTSDAAVQALEILKKMMPLTTSDILSEGTTDGGVNATPDEQAFAAEQAGYYIKYQNAHLRMAATWPDPSKVRLSALPVQTGGAGGTVFWDTGIVLFKYGSNKQKAADFVQAVAKDDRIWKESIAGNKDTGIPAVGQLPILESKWKAWEATPPDFITANPWARAIHDGLANAKAIAP